MDNTIELAVNHKNAPRDFFEQVKVRGEAFNEDTTSEEDAP